MADNVTTSTGAPATLPAGTVIAARLATYSGDAALIAPVGLVAFSGSDDAKTAVDLPGDVTYGLDVDVSRVQGTVTVAGSVSISGTATVSGTVAISGTPSVAQSGSWTVAATQSGTWTVTQSGTWNIGTVTTLPARTRTADAISVAQQTDAIMQGLTALTPKFAAIAAASSGNNTIIAAVASKKIRILALNIVAAGAVNIYGDDTNGTVIWGGSTNKIGLAANGGEVLPYCPVGHFETGVGYGFRLNLSAAVSVSGSCTYVEAG